MVDTLDSKPSAERRESSSLSLATIWGYGGMVDTVVLEATVERRGGSSPSIPTKRWLLQKLRLKICLKNRFVDSMPQNHLEFG